MPIICFCNILGYDAQDSKNVVKFSEIVLRFMRSLRREWEKRLKKYDRWLDLWMGDKELESYAQTQQGSGQVPGGSGEYLAYKLF